jgi:hypothetical protein
MFISDAIHSGDVCGPAVLLVTQSTTITLLVILPVIGVGVRMWLWGNKMIKELTRFKRFWDILIIGLLYFIL